MIRTLFVGANFKIEGANTPQAFTLLAPMMMSATNIPEI